MDKKFNVECSYCKNPLYRRKSQIEANKTGKFYCNKACRGKDETKIYNFKCVECGKEFTRNGNDVHRIIHAKNRKSSTTKKIANSTRKRMAGKKLSDIHKKKLSESHIGHRQSVEAIEKQISSRKEYYKNNDKKGSKPVVMKTTDGVLTLRFSSSRRAVEWLREHGYPKASKGNITACACGLLKRCYKATWRYDI